MRALDRETASSLGLWLGGIGAIIGVVGVIVSLYSIFAREPNLWILTGTGWVAAILVAFSLCAIIFKLGEKLSDAHTENQTLRDQNLEDRARLEQMQQIDAYLTSRIQVQEAIPRRVRSRVRAEQSPDSDSSTETPPAATGTEKGGAE